MDLTNDTYVIRLRGKAWTERYERDAGGWVKVSARGRTFRATAEQVLNHLLPALAGVKAGLTVEVERREAPRRPRAAARPARKARPAASRVRRAR